MDKNFISVFRSIPLWPNGLIPLDEILNRLASALGIDTTGLDPLLFIGGILGFRDIRIHRFDGVTTVTGQVVISTELILAPFQSYIGFVIGNPTGGDTAFPFSLRIKDEPPIKNKDEIFEIDENASDPQLAAFQPVEKNPEAGFFDVDSWRLSLRDIPAKIRILKGVTRVEPLDPNQPARGFRELPNEHVDVGIVLSLDFDADGNLELWPPDPAFTGAAGDPAGALDLDLGWFHVNESPLYCGVKGMGYHRANTHFPDGFKVPAGLDESWSGFIAEDIGGFWWKKPANPEEEVHIYGITFRDLLIGNDVFAIRGSFEHAGGPDDPFNSTVPVPKEEIPESRWSLRKIEVWVAEGAGDILQFGGQVTVAAILGFFKNQPVKFDVSVGRILKDIEVEGPSEPITLTLPVVQLTGALAPVQNHTQPTPDGRLRMPMFEVGGKKFSFQINRIRFELIFPGGTVSGIDIPTRIQLQLDLGIELGHDSEAGEDNPAFEIEVPGVGFVYPSSSGIFGTDFKILWEGIWLETTVTVPPLRIHGYEFSISRVGFGFGAGDTDAYWLSFDAHLQFPDTLGRAEVYGMRLGWDNDGMLFSIEGIGVEVKKPGFELVGILKFLDGSSSFVPVGEEPITIQPGSISGFVRLSFPAAGDPFAFEVGLTHGKYMVDETGAIHSFWMLMAELIFPGGLPLGFADLAFYGLAIAVGNNVTPRKAATTSWFDWYSKELPKYSVIASNKWTAAHDRFAFGLGLVCGSSIRSGYPHNERLLGVYNSSGGQGSTWLFEGKVRFLKEVTKPGDPQIAILFVTAPDQVLLRAEFHFSFPAEGDAAAGLVMTARGMIEVLSDRTGAGRHHVYLGRNQPYSERINASVLLGFLTSRAFYMLDWSDLALSNTTLPPLAMAFGFAQGWSLDKKFGPLRFYLEANIELEVGFSFVSAVYGFLRIYGGIGLRIWGFGFGLSIDAAFTLFVSDGWKLTGTVKVKLNLPWPIPDYKKTLEFDWGPGAVPPAPLLSPLRQLALSSPSFDGNAPLHEWSETNVLGVPSDFNPERSELAVDGTIVLAFRAPAGKRVPWISGVDAQPMDGSGEWKFRYTVEDVILRRRLPGTTAFEPVPDSFKRGFWEINSIAPATSSAPTTEGAPLSQVISIWGETPGEQLYNLGGLERSGSITWIAGFLDLYSTWPCGPDAVMDLTCVHFDLTSFRMLDDSYTRVTLLPDGAPIRSRSPLNPDAYPIESAHIGGLGVFVVLDEVVQNPRPDLWNKHEKVLSLPYLYRAMSDGGGFLPFSSELDVDLPPATYIEVTLLSVFPDVLAPGELFTVQGIHDGEVIVSVTAAGFGLHDLTLNQQDSKKPITTVRITSRLTAPQTHDDSRVSVLASLCYRTSDQSKLHQYILEQRESLNQLVEILQVPPGLPGQNADHFHLHPQGTVYEVTPVVTCERKGPESNWEIVHDHLPLAMATITVGPPPADLTPWLAETIPAREKDPFYLDDDMQLRFNHSYGPEMYTVSGFDFRVEVLDVQRQPVPLQQEWTFSEEPALSPLQELLLEATLSSSCVTADINAVRKKLTLTLRPVLSPRTYYYLVIRSSAHPDRSLYETPFFTSRYHSFDEQYAELEANVVHELLPRPTEDTMLESLLGALPVSTREEEHVLFEKIGEDALGFAFRERSERGELVVFYHPGDTGPGAPRVIMIDSPEPLLMDRRTEFHVSGPAGMVAPLMVRNFDGTRTLLFARDGSAVVDLPTGDYVLTTTYRREVEGLPTQRIDGDSSPSTVSITLTVTEAQILMEAL
jgi:hypothetical protein